MPGLIAHIIECGGRDAELTELGLDPYAVAKLCRDDRGVTDPALRRLVARHRRGWTVEKLRAMPTEVIEDHLRQRGISWDRERFHEAAMGGYSAWDLTFAWTAHDTFTGSDEDVDFAGFAACELWRRLFPERPSIEMLDDQMQEGYSLCAAGHMARACDVWWRIWEVLRSRFTSAHRTIDQATELFSGTQFLGNWLQDFERQLTNTAAYSRTHAKMGRRFCEEWIDQFVDEDGRRQASVRRTLATFLTDLGQSAAATSLRREVVERWPCEPWGYLDLADECLHPHDPRATSDLTQAREWLERGLTNVGSDPHDREALEHRLANLHRFVSLR